MHSETFEDIEVICLFSRLNETAGSQVKPLRIRRKGGTRGNGQVYKVRKITCQWNSMRGKFRRCHYAILTDRDDIYELVFDSGTLEWKLRYEE